MKVLSLLFMAMIAAYNRRSANASPPLTCATTEIPNCINYEFDTTCIACDNDKFPTKDKRECADCGTIIDGCTSCEFDTATKCLKCEGEKSPKYDGSECLVCSVEHCEKCDTSNTCKQCISPKVLGEDPNCVDCDYDMQQCAECSAWDVCTKCNPGKYLKAQGADCDDCSTLIPNCEECDDSSGETKCTKCSGSNVLHTDNTCGSCDNGANCETCNPADDKCASCAEGKYLNSEKTDCVDCSAAISNCEECDESSGTTKCTKCTGANLLYADGLTCDTCAGSNCATCKEKNVVPPKAENTACATCPDDYYIEGDDCVECSTAISDCGKCEAHSDGSAICTQCSSGVLHDDNTCKACGITDCVVCDGDDATKCIECKEDTHLNDAGTGCQGCGDIIPGCAECESDQKSSPTCTKCDDDKTLTDQDNCVTCTGQNCLLCKDGEESKCATCPLGTAMNADSTACAECEIGKYPKDDQSGCDVCTTLTDSDCKNCAFDDETEKTICIECNTQGRYPTADGQECCLCGSSLGNCKECGLTDGKTTCATCGDAKVPSSDKQKCVTCGVDGCNTCSDDDTCDSCNEGKELDDNKDCQDIPTTTTEASLETTTTEAESDSGATIQVGLLMLASTLIAHLLLL